jgi:predicted amidohydrolase YtcJ
MDAVEAVKNPQLILNSAKIFVDGSFGNATASVLKPYVSKGGSSNFGQSLWQLEGLVEVIRAVRASGLQPHLHAIGDAAIRLALDSLEQAQASEKTKSELPAVIAHSELIADSDIHRYKQLSIVANLQPLWARQDDMMNGSELKLGWERSQRLYRMRDLLDCGAMLSFGSDWPVSDLSPLLGIMTAVSRQTPDGHPEGGWTPEQRMTLSEALLAYSDGTAKQLGNLAAGSLLLGKSADFLVLDKNVFDLPPLDLPNLEAQAVYVAGELVYNRL